MSQPAIDLPFTEFESRLKKFCRFQKKAKLDAVVVMSEVNLYYFTGIISDNAVLLLENKKEPIFYTDFRYLVMAKRKAPGLKSKDIRRGSQARDFWSKAGKNWKRAGYEGTIPASTFIALKEALPQVEWVDVSADIMVLRSIKSKAEQKLMRHSIAQNDKMYRELIRQVRVGQTEWEIRNIARRLCDELGQGEAFATIACVGKNAAECHHVPDDTVLKKNQTLLMDLGVRVNHYCSDMTRCAIFGKASKLYQEIFQIVHRANREAIAAIRPGLPCSAIDDVARSIISRAGYGKAFGHSLGHSVGLEIHEMPGFSPAIDTILEPGMLITVEPGIYLPKKLGIRLEDMILVTRTGCELLSQTPHEIVCDL